MKKLCGKTLILFTTLQSFCTIEDLMQFYYEIKACAVPARDGDKIAELRSQIIRHQQVFEANPKNCDSHTLYKLISDFCDRKQDHLNALEEFHRASQADKAGLCMTLSDGSLYLQHEIELYFKKSK